MPCEACATLCAATGASVPRSDVQIQNFAMQAAGRGQVSGPSPRRGRRALEAAIAAAGGGAAAGPQMSPGGKHARTGTRAVPSMPAGDSSIGASSPALADSGLDAVGSVRQCVLDTLALCDVRGKSGMLLSDLCQVVERAVGKRMTVAALRDLACENADAVELVELSDGQLKVFRRQACTASPPRMRVVARPAGSSKIHLPRDAQGNVILIASSPRAASSTRAESDAAALPASSSSSATAAATATPGPPSNDPIEPATPPSSARLPRLPAKRQADGPAPAPECGASLRDKRFAGLSDTLVAKIQARQRLVDALGPEAQKQREKALHVRSLPDLLDKVHFYMRSERKSVIRLSVLAEGLAKKSSLSVPVAKERLALLARHAPEWCSIKAASSEPNQKPYFRVDPTCDPNTVRRRLVALIP